MARINEKDIKTILIDWKPDRKSGIPLYSQIVSYFSSKISNGDWVSGQLIPPQRALSELFGVNRSTIVEAMNELASLGMIESEFGGGTRITNDTWSLMMRGKVPNWQSYIESSGFHSNIPEVQRINQLEFEDGFIRLGTGELSGDLLPSSLVKKALSRLSEKRLFINYPDPLGLPGLRQAVCTHLKQYDIDLAPSCILIVSGALQALQLIASGLVQSKSTIYVESPSYINSLKMFQSSGAHLESLPTDNSGVLPWTIRAGEYSVRDSMLYTIPTFQNPTGSVMPLSRRMEILNYCKEHRLPIVEDDVLRDLWLDSPPPPPIKSLDEKGSVIYIGSISKCFAPGMRIGWVAGPESVIQRLADVKMQMDYGVSSVVQQLVEELLKSGLYYEGTDQVRRQLRGQRDLMMDILNRYFYDIADWRKPEGGFFVWLKLKKRISANKIYDLALKEKMLINPGGMYDKKFDSCIRLTYGYLPPDQLDRHLKRLSEIIHEAAGQEKL